MRLTLTMTVTAIGSLLFGLAYLLFPETMLSFYGAAIDPYSQWTARYLGATILGFGVVNWLGRNIRSGAALRAIISGTFAVSVIGFVVSILQLLNNSGGMFAWAIAVIYFLLSLGYGDFIFRTAPPE